MPRSRSRMAEGEGGQPKETKKRTRNPSEWKREKRKRLRVAGKSYINSKGDLVQERKIGEDCRCRRKCYQIVAEEQRHKLFDGYYALNSHDEQNAYLFGLIRKHDIARKRHKDSDRRTCSYKYFVRIRGKEVQICRLAFAHIHGISPHKIRILCQKQDQNIMFPRDGRGRHENRPRKISEETLNQVRNHIYSIIRSDRVREFLKEEKHNGPDLNITKMWKDYLEKYDSNFFSLQFGNEKSHHSNHSNHHSSPERVIPASEWVCCCVGCSGAPGITGLQSHDQQQQHQQMSQERVAMPSFSGAHPHLSHHVPHAHVHPHHPHQHAHQHHAVAYPNLAQQYQTMQVMASNLGLLDHQSQHQQQQQQALYGSHPNHNPHSGGREGEQQLEQPPPPQPTQPPPHTETSKVDKPKGPKPIVKHWLYSKTFHDEFKFQDFLSLKKKLWMLKEDKAQNPQLKTERKQKSPKKISREKELALHAAAVQHTISSNTNQSVSSTTSSHHLAPAPPPVQHQQPPDMYILPVGVGLQDLSTADMLQQQHHAMQLNLHTFSAQSNVLSPIITATGQVLPQSSGTSVVTLPAATMSLAQNSCNYMNVNSAAFYQ